MARKEKNYCGTVEELSQGYSEFMTVTSALAAVASYSSE